MAGPLIVVVGGSLAGLAAALRLDRVGHAVLLCEQREALGPGLEVANEADRSVLTLPAAWRDLFQNSGRDLDAVLAEQNLELVPAPPRRYRLADGRVLELPDRCGEQAAALTSFAGESTALDWQGLLDELEDVWQVLLRFGLETEFDGRVLVTERRLLRPRRTLFDLAGRVPALTEVILAVAARLGQDPRRLPGWHATRLSMERAFGRWRLVDRDQVPHPADTLAGLLIDRAATGGIDLRTSSKVLSIRSAAGEHRIETTAGELYAGAVVSTVDPFTHADLTAERVDLTVANRLRRAPGGGPRWDSWRTLFDLPRLQPARPGVLVASSWSPGGSDPWAQLLTGSLAARRVHQDLTGEDLPSDLGYRLPRR